LMEILNFLLKQEMHKEIGKTESGRLVWRYVYHFLEGNPAVGEEDQLRAYAMSLINIIKELMTLNPLYNEELKQYLNYFTPNEPSPLTDFAAAITSADAAELQVRVQLHGLGSALHCRRGLATTGPHERLECGKRREQRVHRPQLGQGLQTGFSHGLFSPLERPSILTVLGAPGNGRVTAGPRGPKAPLSLARC